MMETPNFTRVLEDFICEHCGAEVKGNGYTNHCPECLSSKHVDVNPGDRMATCGGVMYAIGYELVNGAEWIIQACSKCKHVRRNRVAAEDSRNAVIALSSGNMDAFLVKLKK